MLHTCWRIWRASWYRCWRYTSQLDDLQNGNFRGFTWWRWVGQCCGSLKLMESSDGEANVIARLLLWTSTHILLSCSCQPLANVDWNVICDYDSSLGCLAFILLALMLYIPATLLSCFCVPIACASWLAGWLKSCQQRLPLCALARWLPSEKCECKWLACFFPPSRKKLFMQINDAFLRHDEGGLEGGRRGKHKRRRCSGYRKLAICIYAVAYNLKYLLCALHLPFDCNYAFHLKTVYFGTAESESRGNFCRCLFPSSLAGFGRNFCSFHPICDCLRCSSLNMKLKLNSNTAWTKRFPGFFGNESLVDCSRSATSCFRVHDKQIFVTAILAACQPSRLKRSRVRESSKGGGGETGREGEKWNQKASAALSVQP